MKCNLVGREGRQLSILCASFALTACGMSPDTALETQNPAKGHFDVIFDGELNSKSFAAIEKQVNSNTKSLVITSGGGDIESAINLGNLVKKYDLNVVVEDYCLSACAHFVFVAGKTKYINDNSFVALHGTATSRKAYLEASGRKNLAVAYENLAKIETSFYRNLTLSQDLLVQPMVMIEPSCYVEVSVQYGFNGIWPSIVTKHPFYVPSRKELEGYGVFNIAGEWPDSDVEFSKIQTRLDTLAGRPAEIVFGSKSTLSAKKEVLPLPNCGNGKN